MCQKMKVFCSVQQWWMVQDRYSDSFLSHCDHGSQVSCCCVVHQHGPQRRKSCTKVIINETETCRGVEWAAEAFGVFSNPAKSTWASVRLFISHVSSPCGLSLRSLGFSLLWHRGMSDVGWSCITQLCHSSRSTSFRGISWS